MKRACRKNSVVGIIVGVIVAFVIFVLSSYVNHLIAIRDIKSEKTVDSASVIATNFTVTNNTSYMNKLSVNNSAYSTLSQKYINVTHKCKEQNIQIIILLFIYAIIISVIITIIVCMNSWKFPSYQMNQRTNDIEPEIAASVKVYVSVMTQTSANL